MVRTRRIAVAFTNNTQQQATTPFVDSCVSLAYALLRNLPCKQSERLLLTEYVYLFIICYNVVQLTILPTSRILVPCKMHYSSYINHSSAHYKHCILCVVHCMQYRHFVHFCLIVCMSLRDIRREVLHFLFSKSVSLY